MAERRPSGADGRDGGPRRRESFAERRERRAAVDDPAVVLEAAARFLEVRSRSVAEVRRRLTTNGYRPGSVDGAITRMTELGMLDDAAFAQAWVESRDRSRPRGERAIRVELGQKGLDKTVIDEVLALRRAGGPEGDESGAPDGRSGRTRFRGPGRRGALDRASTPGPWRASPTHGSGAPARTRYWHGTASIRRRAGRSPRRPWCRSPTSWTVATSPLSRYQRETRYSASAKTPRRLAEALSCCHSSPMNDSPGTSLTPRVWRGRPASSKIGRSSQP